MKTVDFSENKFIAVCDLKVGRWRTNCVFMKVGEGQIIS